ncbi:MAG: CHASE domain-containing protein [Planctomycetes bacterium]|nr:CHASE domain-containing protein [Planctomycetota bacterium]
MDRVAVRRHGDAVTRHPDEAGAAAMSWAPFTELGSTAPCREPPAGPIEPCETPERYTVRHLHSEGGLGRIWIVRDEEMNRDVVLKVLSPEHAQNAAARARFLREAQVAGQLEHPNIVSVYELGGRPDLAQPYYTMRYVRGKTLSARIAEHHRKRRKGTESPLEMRRLLNAFLCVCNAIAYAHSRGVVHRDLKPANVVLGEFGEVILLDWGLAKVAGAREGRRTGKVDLSETADLKVTLAGSVLGTPAYMSPEQAAGDLEAIGPATDVYGLGAILFEILTGRPPHAGVDPKEIVGHVLHGPAPRAASVLPAVSRSLDAVCARAMARSAARRYAKVSDLVDDVQRYLADQPVSVHHPRAGERVLRWVRQHPTFTAVAALVIVFTLLFGANLLRLTLLERLDRLTGALDREIASGSEVLSAVRSLFLSSPSVSAAEFQAFVSPFLDEHGELEALQWVAAVAAAERAAFEEERRAAGAPDFELRERAPDGELVPAAERGTYYPVVFVAPLVEKEEALGFDLGSSAEHSQALIQAHESGRVTASGLLAPTGAEPGDPGFLLLCPVYGEDGAGGGRLAGCVLGVCSVRQLMASAWSAVQTDHLDVRVQDVTDPARPYLLWRNVAGERPGPGGAHGSL